MKKITNRRRNKNEETTSFVNSSLITDLWFDSSRQKHTDSRNRGRDRALHHTKIIILRTKHTMKQNKQTNNMII